MQEERKLLEAKFAEIDTDYSGTLTYSEMGKLLARVYGYGAPRAVRCDDKRGLDLEGAGARGGNAATSAAGGGGGGSGYTSGDVVIIDSRQGGNRSNRAWSSIELV